MNCIDKVWKHDELVEEKGWELDLNKIGTRSNTKDDVVLPYSGDLGLGKDYTAELVIRILRPYEDADIFLRIMEAGEKKPFATFGVEASREEIKRVLEPVLAANGTQGKKSGLEPYWFGFYQANYLAWRQLSDEYICGLIFRPKIKKTLENQGYKIVSGLKNAS